MVTGLGRVVEVALVDPGKPSMRLREGWALSNHLLQRLGGPVRMTTAVERHAMKEMGARIGRVELYRPARLGHRILETSGEQIGAAQSDKRGDVGGIDRTGGDKILDGVGPFPQPEVALGKTDVQITPRAQW